MTSSRSRRLRGYAVASALQVVVLLGLLVPGLPGEVGALALIAVSLPLFWAWGAYQADLAVNPDLDETERTRWRMLLACVPGGMALYWYRHVQLRTPR